jgi:hypothetical protein
MDARSHLDGKLLLALIGSAVLGIFFWTAWPLYPFKLLVVLMHESGHAAATYFVGGSVDSISISRDQGGLTMSRFADQLWRHVVVSSAGYVGSAVSGCVLVSLAARTKTGKWPLVALALWCTTVALLFVRDGFTLMFTAGCALVLFALARFGFDWLRRAVLVFLGSFSVCYALYDIRDDLLHLHSSGASDADTLARLTYIPAIVWGVAWGALSLVLIALTLRRVLVDRTQSAAPPVLQSAR